MFIVDQIHFFRFTAEIHAFILKINIKLISLTETNDLLLRWLDGWRGTFPKKRALK